MSLIGSLIRQRITRTNFERSVLTGALLAFVVGAQNAIPKAIPVHAAAGMMRKQASVRKPVLMPASNNPVFKSDQYGDSDCTITFEYMPSASGKLLTANMCNISETRILHAQTHDGIYDQASGTVTTVPRLTSVSDNFGNVYRVVSIDPEMLKQSSGIAPSKKVTFKIYLSDKIVAKAESLSFDVPKGIFGNADPIAGFLSLSRTKRIEKPNGVIETMEKMIIGRCASSTIPIEYRLDNLESRVFGHTDPQLSISERLKKLAKELGVANVSGDK